MKIIATAPQRAPLIGGGHVAGELTLSGIALACLIVFVLALRKSDRLKRLQTRDGIGLFGLLTGTVWIAAGASWASLAVTISAIPTSVLGDGSMAGNIGQGGMALTLTLLIFLPRWEKRLIYPGLLAIAAAVTYGTAGGVWEFFVGAARMLVAQFTGAA